MHLRYRFPALSRFKYVALCGCLSLLTWQGCGAVGQRSAVHVMGSVAEAGRVVTDRAGDPGAVVEYGVRFSSPVAVPDDDKGATLEVSGTVAEKLDGNRVAVDLDARVGDSKVLAKARAVVQLA